MRRLPPQQRALLDLSFRHRWQPDEIAHVLAVDVDTVVGMRDAALVTVAADLGLSGANELPFARALLSGMQTGSNGHDAVERARPRARSRLALPAAVTLCVIAAAIAATIVLGGGGSPHRVALRSQSVAPSPAPALSPVPAAAHPAPPHDVMLWKLGGAPVGARASARLTRSRLNLTISGLPRHGPGSYAVWLFSSFTRHRTLARFAGGSAQLEITLPRGFRSYGWLDVMRVTRRYSPHRKRVLEVPLAQLAQ